MLDRVPVDVVAGCVPARSRSTNGCEYVVSFSASPSMASTTVVPLEDIAEGLVEGREFSGVMYVTGDEVSVGKTVLAPSRLCGSMTALGDFICLVIPFDEDALISGETSWARRQSDAGLDAPAVFGEI